MKDVQEDARTADHAQADVVDDRERRRVDEWLQQLVGTAQLSLDDYERRAGALWGAWTRSELAVVTADLPTAVGEELGDRRSRPLSPVLRFCLLFGLAGAAIAWAGSSARDAVATSGAPERPQAMVVGAGSTAFDVGTQARTVTVVVPEGVYVNLAALDVQGSGYCDEACAHPTGPSLKILGTFQEDVHVLSQDEWDSGWVVVD